MRFEFPPLLMHKRWLAFKFTIRLLTLDIVSDNRIVGIVTADQKLGLQIHRTRDSVRDKDSAKRQPTTYIKHAGTVDFLLIWSAGTFYIRALGAMPGNAKCWFVVVKIEELRRDAFHR